MARMLPSARVSEIRFTLRSSILRRGALAFAAACALLCPVAWAQERVRLIGVKAGGDAVASSVELIGDRPLSFTTLKLLEPSRVVVDFAETELSGVPRELEVDDGTIRRVAVAAAGQKTARVVIELAGDADFDVRAHGNRVEVRVPRIAPLLAKAEAPPGPARAAEPATMAAPAQSPALEPSPAPEPSQPPAIARAAEPSLAPRPVAAAEAPPVAPGPEPEKRASLPTVALVGSGRARTAPAPAAPLESAAARKHREREERIAAYAAAQRAAAEKVAAARKAAREKHVALAERAAANERDAAERVAASRKARALAAADKSTAERVARTLAAAEKAAGASRAAAEKKRLAAEKAEARHAAATAAADRRARAAALPQRKLAAADPSHAITGIGFRPVGDGQVIVHSNQPLEYRVSREDNVVLVHLPSAAIPLPNNRRPLDTRFFNGPVQRVAPVAVAGGTDLRIELRGHPAYQLVQSGTVLTVTFSGSR
jgi:hypothetical protein